MNIDKLKELEEKATKGPFRWSTGANESACQDGEHSPALISGNGFGVLACDHDVNGPNKADADYIQVLMNLAPHLIALWEAAAKMRDSGNLEQAYGTDRPVLAALTALENA